MQMLLAPLALAIVVGLGVGFFLAAIGAQDAVLFGVMTAFSIAVAGAVSPDGSLLRGAMRLRLYDWVVCLGVAGLVSSVGPDEPPIVRTVRFFSFFVFFLGGAIGARRGNGAGEKLAKQQTNATNLRNK